MSLSDRNDPAFVGVKEGWLACVPMILLGIALSMVSWLLEWASGHAITLEFLTLFALFWFLVYLSEYRISFSYVIVWSELLWMGHGIVLVVKYFT
ncbi:MAG: hypothetical protein A3D65_00955 [Candidatus Lloydbacteria bacterium RIFCSPHIGHO2_02_FULL_50_13]|uniref:Uncharacterized protein n=1 Tax=Candidatus Lloydbacteria bacterium RIFCSPHIGHO2_02_FULL_50_13 TaxID=1798661 RepID=A0A1G2D251_9BACT|nr:MAG: hypothetical protein A3D65_00955 [Candidatus Lloydbacteria bacterium RIFCSPHIGHO2_02_FULL_50_13]